MHYTTIIPGLLVFTVTQSVYHEQHNGSGSDDKPDGSNHNNESPARLC